MAKTVKYYMEVDASGAVKSAGEAQKGFLDVDNAADRTGVATIALGNIMANAASMMANSLANVVSQSQELFSRQEQAEQKAAAVIKATGGAAGFEIEQLKVYASELQSYTTVGDESILESMSTLLTFRQVSGDTFKQATELALDTSMIFGSLESATLQIGKALEDPIEGMTALRRVGVTFNELQKEQVKDFLAQNNLAAAQGVILDNLRGQLGGVARELALTDTGKWEQFMNRIGDSQEDLGGLILSLKVGLIPVFERLLSISGAFVGKLEEWLGLDLASQLNDERIKMNGLVLSITSLNEENEDRQALINELVKTYPEFLGKINLEKTTNEELRTALEEVNQLYIDRAAIQIATASQEEAIVEAGQALVAQKTKEGQAYQTLTRLNEQYGFGIDLTTGTLQENLIATREALTARGEWANSATLGRIATNEEAMAAENLLGVQNDLVVAYNKVTKAQNQVVEASEFRKVIEDSLVKSGSEAIKVEGVVEITIPDAPELPEIPTPEPVDVFIPAGEIVFGDFAMPHWDEILFIPDGTIDTLNKNLAKIDLMPDSTLQNLQDQLSVVQDLYVNSQSDAERQRLAVVEESIQLQIQAKTEGVDVDRIIAEEYLEEQKETFSNLYNTASDYVNVFSQIRQQEAERQITRIDKETQKRVKAIDVELKKENLSETERAKLIQERQQIEASAEEKKATIKRETFDKEKRANTVMAIAQTALAIIKALPNIPLSIAVGALGALQTAVVASQPNPYLEGGLIEERMPNGLSAPGIKMISINENGSPEYVVNAESTKKFQPILDLMNYNPGQAEQLIAELGVQPFLSGGLISESSNSETKAKTVADYLRIERELMELLNRSEISNYSESTTLNEQILSGTLDRFNEVGGLAPVQPSINALSGANFDVPTLETNTITDAIAEAIENGLSNFKANLRLVAEGRELNVASDNAREFETKQTIPFN